MASLRCFVYAACLSMMAYFYISSSGTAPFQTVPADWELDGEYSGPTNHSRPLIAVVGLSRTGTSSMSKALAMLNLVPYHTIESLTKHLDFWYYYLDGRIKNPDVRKLLTKNHDRPDAVLDCWYALLAPEIIKAYPDTKFILTTRETEGWLKSYAKYVEGSSLYHYARQARRLFICKMSRMLSVGPILRFTGAIPPSDGLDLEKLPHLMHVWELSDFVMYGNHEPKSHPLWYNAQDRHTAYIRSIVPEGQLFEFDLSKNHGWDEIVTFLDLPRDDPIVAQRLTEAYPKVFASNKVQSAGMSQRSKEATFVHECVTVAVWIVILSITLKFGMLDMLKSRTWVPKLLIEYFSRCKVWLQLMSEYSQMSKNFAIDNDGYFDNSVPETFSDLHCHTGLKSVLNARCTHGFRSKLNFIDDYSVIPTQMPIEKAAAAALGALGLACADLFELRTGQCQKVTVRRSQAGLAIVRPQVTTQASRLSRNDFANNDPTCQSYRCGDGKFVLLQSNGSLEMKKNILEFFDIEAESMDALSAAVLAWKNADELEKAMREDGLTASVCRTSAEWRSACYQSKLPPVEVDVRFKNTAASTRKNTGTSRRAEMFVANKAVVATPVRKNSSDYFDSVRTLCTGPSVTKALSDVLVLDLSQIAGSHAVGKCLVAQGANVIRVILNNRQSTDDMADDSKLGEKNDGHMEIDINSAAGKARLWKLLEVADVLIDGYSDGVLDTNGFNHDHVLSTCPHMVYLKVSYDMNGPFASMYGAEDNASLCAGLLKSRDTKLTADRLLSQAAATTGYLGAFSVVSALCQRQLAAVRNEPIQGVYTRVSQCNTATWTCQFESEPMGFKEYMSRASNLVWGCGRTVDTECLGFPVMMELTNGPES